MSSEVSGAIVQYGIPQPPAYLQSDPSPRPGLDSKHNKRTIKLKMHKLRKRLVAIISITKSDHKAYIENYIVGAFFSYSYILFSTDMHLAEGSGTFAQPSLTPSLGLP